MKYLLHPIPPAPPFSHLPSASFEQRIYRKLQQLQNCHPLLSFPLFTDRFSRPLFPRFPPASRIFSQWLCSSVHTWPVASLIIRFAFCVDAKSIDVHRKCPEGGSKLELQGGQLGCINPTHLHGQGIKDEPAGNALQSKAGPVETTHSNALKKKNISETY